MTGTPISRRWHVLTTAIAVAVLLVACGGGEPPGGPVPEVESVTIAGATTLTLEVGQTRQLSADVVASGGASTEVTWATSNPDAVRVDGSGLVTALSLGQAEVTATSVVVADVGDAVTVEVVPEGTLNQVVTSSEDYDPYDLQGFTPDEPIEGTLRYVLANAPSGSVITFADGIDEIVLRGVDVFEPGNVDAHLVFREDVTLQGPAAGLTLRAESGYQDGDPGDPFTYRSRVAFVPSGVDVTLRNLTLTGGSFIFYGAGVRNDGRLTIIDSEITGNRAWELGGGIFNRGSLTVRGSRITDNRAVTEDDEVDRELVIRGGPGSADLGDGGYGGGIYNDAGGTVTVSDSTIADNAAKVSGAGIYDLGDGFQIVNSAIDGNAADEAVADTDGTGGNTTAFANFGGGVYTAGSFTAENTTFSGNSNTELGGGMFLDQDGSAELLATVAFDGNSADFGGGIFHQFAGSADNLTPSEPVADPAVTFSGNTATSSGDADYARQNTGDLVTPASRGGKGPGRFFLAPERDTASYHR